MTSTLTDDRRLRARLAGELARARVRTLALTDVDEATQRAQIDPLMSPLVWDLAHIGNYEELWLLRALDGRPAIDAGLDDLYNAFEHPRWSRPSLPILGPREARDYDARVRDAVLDLLDRTEADPDDPLRRDGFVYGMVLQHEHQHDETLLATHQLRGAAATGAPGGWDGAPAGLPWAGGRLDPPRDEMALHPGGTVTVGTSTDPWAYDNERPAHPVDLAPFWLDTTPVTNDAYAAFVDAGGYDDARWWSADGWSWRQEASLVAPLWWRREGHGAWSVLRFGRRGDLRGDEPVQHVCWYEADAFARWAGKRLPTEAEWEAAATWSPAGRARRYPWGDGAPGPAQANLGTRHDGPVPVGAILPAGASPWGVHQLIGDVWEWTASDFAPYPGFRAFPYDEYSQVFFQTAAPAERHKGYKVLRGGSWAADPVAVRGTFRNWDHPIRRQIFAGFRCARSA